MQANKLFDLGGKVALVTGGSRGIGFQMAEALGEMGCKLAISARNQHELDAASAALGRTNIEVLTIAKDLGAATADAAASLVGAVLDHYGKIDILVNNAGTVWGASAIEHSPEAWRKVMGLNVDACFHVAREVARRSMIPNNSGKIINIASIAGFGGSPEWGKHNINVNAICPGYFPTKLSAGLAERADEIAKVTPLGRAGGDYDIKGPVVFFASEASRHVSGQALAIDGGGSAVILN